MNKHSSSFRDPSGFIFYKDTVLYRAIAKNYAEHYDFLFDSGLFSELLKKQYIIPHEECPLSDFVLSDNYYKVIKPLYLPFITYPYEWCFSQLKDAALLTLKIQRIALRHNMVLKDASSYNIQFYQGKPLFIDTLSFEKYQEGHPWIAYRQFCKHFLVPLLLAKYVDVRLISLLKNYIDGIDLDLAVKLLPLKAKLKPAVFMNLCMQAYFSKKYEDKDIDFSKKVHISKEKLLQMNEQLQDLISSLTITALDTEWGNYYTFTNYDKIAFQSKETIVSQFIEKINPASLWDLGANNGHFTRIASEKNINSLAFDIDFEACEKNYHYIKQHALNNLLPVWFDLTNPSPSIGFANEERFSLSKRNHPDCVMALALIHHIAISNNVPLELIAKYFSSLSRYLIIEFVPKSDSQVQKLLMTREDIFPDYTFEGFERAFELFYKIIAVSQVENSERKIYLLEKK